MLVRERMSHPVITVFPETTMEEALALMNKEQISHLPVIDHQGKLIGLISERILLKASPSDATTLSVWESREMMRRLRIDKYMSRDALTIAPDTPIEEAARIMADQQFTGLSVVEGNKLVGFITQKEIFKILLELLGAREPGVRLAVELHKGPGQLLKVLNAIFDQGGDVVSLGAYQWENSDSGEVILKVTNVDSAALEQAVRQQVVRVLDVRTTP